jgi:hypothetical protein
MTNGSGEILTAGGAGEEPKQGSADAGRNPAVKSKFDPHLVTPMAVIS